MIGTILLCSIAFLVGFGFGARWMYVEATKAADDWERERR